MTTFFVSIYKIDLAYGGPEEGGWWFQCGEPVVGPELRAFTTRDEAEAYRDQLEAGTVAELNEGLAPISDVNSEGRYTAMINVDAYPAPYPTERPFYS